MLRILIISLGLVPSALFFVWTERNAALPYLPIWLGWPWIEGESWSLASRVTWNAFLIAAFGALHSGLASHSIQSHLKLGSWMRPVYIAVAGLSLLLLMGIWQHTGVLIWNIPAPIPAPLPWGLGWTSLMSYAVFGFTLSLFRRMNLSEFLGLTSATQPGAVLVGQGPFAWVRHPVYSLTILFFGLASMMSLDRLLITAGMSVYIFIGYRLEEKKLIEQWGDSYRNYQQTVPAFVPRWSQLWKK